MNDHGFVVCAYNRTTDKVKAFMENEAKGTKVVGAYSLEDMVSKLKLPRKVMLLVKGKRLVHSYKKYLGGNLEKWSIKEFVKFVVLQFFEKKKKKKKKNSRFCVLRLRSNCFVLFFFLTFLSCDRYEL